MPPCMHAVTEIAVYEVFTKIMAIIGAEIMMAGRQLLAVRVLPRGAYLSRCSEG